MGRMREVHEGEYRQVEARVLVNFKVCYKSVPVNIGKVVFAECLAQSLSGQIIS